MTFTIVGYRFNVTSTSGETVTHFFKEKPIGISEKALDALVSRSDVADSVERIETLEKALDQGIQGITFAIEQLEQRNEVIEFLRGEGDTLRKEIATLSRSRDNFRHGFHGAVDTLFDNVTIQETADEA